MPKANASADFNGVLPGIWAQGALNFILVVVRVSHVFIAKRSMLADNYHSRRQYISSLIVIMFSVLTSIFSMALVVIIIVMVNEMRSEDGGFFADVGEILHVLYGICVALCTLSVSQCK